MSAPRGADREFRARVVDHETTNMRRAAQGRDPENKAPVQVAMKGEVTRKGTLISQAAKLASRMLGRADVAPSIRGFFAMGATNPLYATAVARALLPRLERDALARGVGGHPIQVQGVGDRGEMPDLVGHDARDLIVESLRLLLTYSGSITTLLDVWASERVSGGRVDWAEVDNLVALLTHRFPPQEEAARDAGGALTTSGIPAAHLVAENGLDGLPRPTPDTLEIEEDIYGRFCHQNAVTALDQVVTDRATAGEVPILILGLWTNAAELATGLGFCTLDQPVTNGGGGEEREEPPARWCVKGDESSKSLRRIQSGSDNW